jgi:CheY-like chemotaxis protein
VTDTGSGADRPADPAGSAGYILVVDDDVDVTRLVAMSLGQDGFEVRVVHEARAGLAAIEERRPDLVLLDVAVPDVDGFELCRQLRASPMTASLPIVVLTASGLPAHRVLGLTVGADDYITKPFDPSELIARVRSTLRRNQEMRDVSPLTGLPGNHRILAAIAERFVARKERGWEYAVCYVDLDNFKTVNDVYGFYRGDQMITALASSLQAATVAVPGPPAFLGHIGGDDFLIVCTPEQIGPVTAHGLAAFERASRPLYDPADLARGYFEVVDRQGNPRRHGLLTVSIGVALSSQRTFVDHREVVAAASEMKQVAKRSVGSVVAVDRRRENEPGRGVAGRMPIDGEHRDGVVRVAFTGTGGAEGTGRSGGAIIPDPASP